MNEKISISSDELLEILSRYGYERDTLFKKNIFPDDHYLFLQSSFLDQSIIIPNLEEFNEDILFKIAKQSQIPPHEFLSELRGFQDISVHPTLVAYIDILGFSDLIKDNSNDEAKLNEALNHFKNAFKLTLSPLIRSSREISPSESVLGWQIRIFSDNILIHYSFSDEIRLKGTQLFDSKLDLLLMDVAEYQLNLAIQGYFSRGGIAFGKGYCDTELIFGSALLESVNLEHGHHFPGIVLDEKITKYIQKMGDTPFDDYLNEYCGFYYVNYLYLLKDFNDSMSSGSRDIPDRNWIDPRVKSVLELHKSEVETNLRRFSNDESKYEKYLWVAHYHNAFCRKYFPNLENLIIHDVFFNEAQ